MDAASTMSAITAHFAGMPDLAIGVAILEVAHIPPTFVCFQSCQFAICFCNKLITKEDPGIDLR
jgi:hypothetical protein